MTRHTARGLASLAGLLLIAGCGTAGGNVSSAATQSTPGVHAPSRTPVAAGADRSGDVIALRPDAGPPGTRVTIEGYIPSMNNVAVAPASTYQVQGNIGFGGFKLGLNIAGTTIHWAKNRSGHFTTTFRVPTTAWLTANGTHPLKAGVYKVAIDCIGNVAQRGCAMGPDEAAASFKLTRGASNPAPHPWLRFSPSTARPGQTIHVRGWAPLTNIIGTAPYGYSLTWSEDGQSLGYGALGQVAQSLSGNVSGSFQIPADSGFDAPTQAGIAHVGLEYIFFGRAASAGAPSAKGMVSAVLAVSPFHVRAPLTWNDLKVNSPIHLVDNSNPAAVDGMTVAVPNMADGGLWVSHSGGAAFSTMSISSLVPIADAEGYPVLWGGAQAPQVHAVLLDHAAPSSLFITVAAVKQPYGAPPIFYTPYFSTDRGTTWHAVPVPRGLSQGTFDGFQASGTRIYADWGSGRRTASEYTADGGLTWQNGLIGCPSAGPCLRFGPYAHEYPGMGVGIMQPIMRQNPAHRWMTSTTVTAPVSASPSQLAALSSKRALLIDSSAQYPVELTTNGGRTWQYVALPQYRRQAPLQLMMLANGDLLGQFEVGAGSQWALLPPRSAVWRLIPTTVLPGNITGLTQTGTELWWYPAASPSGKSGPNWRKTLEREL